MKINNDINSLDPQFKKKFDLFWAEVQKLRPDARVFEARRSQERQNELYAQGRTKPGKIVTRTKQSKHIEGKAVDIVFYDDVSTPQYENKPMWSGPYDTLIEIGKKYGIKNLKPKETCHFEDDGKPLLIQQSISMDTALQSLLLLVRSVYPAVKEENKKALASMANTVREVMEKEGVKELK